MTDPDPEADEQSDGPIHARSDDGAPVVESVASVAEAPARPWRRRLGRWLPVLVVAVIGSITAVSLFGSVEAEVGPFDTTLAARPLSAGGTEIELAPLGQIGFGSHGGPLGLTWRLDEIREADARAIVEDPGQLMLDEAALTDDVRSGVIALAWRVALASVVGGALLTFVFRRHWRDVAVGGLVGLVAVGGAFGNGVRTWEPDSLAEPRYTGLLSMAPQAVGDARDVIDRFSDYRAQLAGLVENVTVLYRGTDDLRSYRADETTIRVLHVSDIHLNPQAYDLAGQVVQQYAIDVVVDTGDINDWGTSFEARFVDLIGDLDVPYVFVRGNHDSYTTQRAVDSQPNTIVLDGGGEAVAGLTFWGLGDPRFTPDKSREGSGDDQRRVAIDAGQRVLDGLRRFGTERVDVVLVHDPLMAGELGDRVPLVLAGHRHQVAMETLGESTTLLIEGSTGGGGLRALEGDEPLPLTASVLYFDAETGLLEAMDRIRVAGVNQSDVRIERTVLVDTDPDGDDGDGDGSDEGSDDDSGGQPGA